MVPADRQTVWGVLYELDESDLQALDHHEGRGIAYERVLGKVFLEDGESCLASFYAVISRASTEIPPSRLYMEALITGATEANLPDSYRAFLESLLDGPRPLDSSG